jgi:hypothetical protein
LRSAIRRSSSRRPRRGSLSNSPEPTESM